MKVLRMLGVALGAAGGWYAGYAASAYTRYGRVPTDRGAGSPADLFLPVYEVRETHQVTVHAPADVTFAAARSLSWEESPVVRGLFALREIPARLTGARFPRWSRRPMVERMVSLGWRVLDEVPGEWVVLGAVTQPWKRNVTFRGLPANAFVVFDDPDHAKIVVTIQAEPGDDASSVFRTETRVATTDPASRRKFRRYWSLLSPGIVLIRYEVLRLVKRDAERRARAPLTS